MITCSSERDADRERSYVRLLRSIRAAAVVFAGSGLDDPVANEEMDRHLSAMRADGAAVVHLSPHAAGEPEVGVDNEAGIASMVAALVGLGHRRIAFLAGPGSLYVARERLAGYRRGLADAGIAVDDRLIRTTGFDAAAAWSPSTRCSPATPRSRRSAAPTTCSRSGPCSGWRSSASTCPGRCPWRGSTTSRRPRSPLRACPPCGSRCASSAGAGSSTWTASWPATRRRPCGCRPRWCCATRRGSGTGGRAHDGGPAVDTPDQRGRLMAGALAGRVVLVTGSSRGIGAEVAVKAAAEGATVAVHYHRGADGAARRWHASASSGAEAEAFEADLARRRRRPRSSCRGSSSGSAASTALVNNAGRTQVGPFLEIEPGTGTTSCAPT